MANWTYCAFSNVIKSLLSFLCLTICKYCWQIFSMTYYGSSQGWDSDYDSTWEEDEKDGEPKRKKEKVFYQYNPRRGAAQDLQNYRHGYPDSSPKPNLLFYQNKMPFKPSGEYIDKMHKDWRYDYNTLETNHNFIQWLFPLQEQGMNPQATPLTPEEIRLMRMDQQVMKRFLESYKLMLGFYGIELLDEETGNLCRAEGNWKDRFQNLNNHTHNNLRITRILKCLGEMGFERFQAPLVRFFLEETLCNHTLPRVKVSALEYFMFTVKDKKDRQKLVHFAWKNYQPQDRFIWGPVEKLQEFNPQNDELGHEVTVPEVVVDNEVLEDKPERLREGSSGLLSKTTAYIYESFPPFRWLFIFLRGLYLPFRWLFRGGVGNKDRVNQEQIYVNAAGTEETRGGNVTSVNIPGDPKDRPQGPRKPELERLLNNPKVQGNSKAEYKEMIVSAGWKTSDSMEESKEEANLETKDNEKKQENAPEDVTWSENLKFMPEIRHSKGDDSDIENEDDPGNFPKDNHSKNVLKLEAPASGNAKLAAEGNEAEHSEVLEEHTKDNLMESHGGDREDGERQIANAGNQSEKTKRYDGERGERGTPNVEAVPSFSGEKDYTESVEISKINANTEAWPANLEYNDEGTQKTLLETDKTEPCIGDEETKSEGAANAQPLVVVCGGERDEDNRLAMESKDINKNNFRAQSTESERDKTQPFGGNEKTEHEGVANVQPIQQYGGEWDVDDSSALVMDSKDDESEKFGGQITVSERDRTQPFGGNEKTEHEGVANVQPIQQYGGEGDVDDSSALVMDSKDNESEKFGAQSTESERDRTQQVGGDEEMKSEGDANAQPLLLCGGERDEDNRSSFPMGSKDINEENFRAQRKESERDKTQSVGGNEKTEHEGLANVQPIQQYGGKWDVDDRSALGIESKDNESEKFGAQITESERDRTQQVEGDEEMKSEGPANAQPLLLCGRERDEGDQSALVMDSKDNEREKPEKDKTQQVGGIVHNGIDMPSNSEATEGANET